jgi:hypothetical protein
MTRPSLALALWFLLATAPALADVDWNAHAAADTVVIVTADEDGAERETTIWLCVMAGQGYVRGGGGEWVANALRSGDVKLRVDGAELTLRAAKLTDAGEIERVTAAFREKYGFGDVMATLIRGEPTIFRLTPR